MTSLTLESCKDLGVKPRDAERSKNFFALGLISWMYTRPVDPTIEWIDQKFSSRAAGARRQPRRVQGRPALRRDRRAARALPDPAGQARAWSLPQHHRQPRRRVRAHRRRAAARACRSSTRRTRSRRRPTSCTSCRSTRTSASARCRPKTRSRPPRSRSAPRSPASSASPPPAVPASTSSRRRSVSRSASSCRSCVIDVQRGGPSTGLPTKTEQSDLLLAMYGRHGESPLPIVAAYSPSHCFDAAFEAVRIALKYRTPVILLTDGYVANGSEPWKLPDIDTLPDISVPFADRAEPRRRVLAVPARPRDAGASVGDPGHARADAPHRRHREAGRHRQRQLRAGQPRAHDPHPGRQGGADRQRHPAGRGRGRRRRRRPGARLGQHVGPDQRGGAPRAGRRRQGRARAPRAPQPVPAEPGRGARPLPEGAGPGDEPRPAVEAGAGGVPGRRASRSPRCRACPSAPPRSRTRSWR